MKRKLLIVLFSFGTIGGFGSAGAHWARQHDRRRAAFEAHVARICVDAARAAEDRGGGEARPTPPPGRHRRPHHPPPHHPPPHRRPHH